MKYLSGLFLLLPLFCMSQDTAEKGVNLQVNNPVNQVRIRINLPDSLSHLSKHKPCLLVFYALPNGNSIEWTAGKRMEPGDDWHFAIQQIAAQTRFARNANPKQNLILIYLATEGKSWPAWKRARKEGPAEIKRIVDSVTGLFREYHPSVMLNSHSGGGSFIFGYLDAVKQIPKQITRIGFIDSDYGYEDSLHTQKLVEWLKRSRKNTLTVLAYNDSVVIYNGKPLVSPTGGTWYRSKLMQQKLSNYFLFKKQEDSSFITYRSLFNRISIQLKTNSEGKIYHTEQVARNGFIHTLFSGTKSENKAGYQYWGDLVYEKYIR
jgi:hypothetical protein